MKLEKFNFLQNRYRIYLLAHLGIILLVIAFFKIIPDVKLAALSAGALFLCGPAWVLIFELRAKKLFKSFATYGAILFLLASALPIFLLRIFNWNEAFENLHLPAIFGGFSGPEMHKASNDFFYLMLASFVFDAIFASRREKRKSEGL